MSETNLPRILLLLCLSSSAGATCPKDFPRLAVGSHARIDVDALLAEMPIARKFIPFFGWQNNRPFPTVDDSHYPGVEKVDEFRLRGWKLKDLKARYGRPLLISRMGLCELPQTFTSLSQAEPGFRNFVKEILKTSKELPPKKSTTPEQERSADPDYDPFDPWLLHVAEKRETQDAFGAEVHGWRVVLKDGRVLESSKVGGTSSAIAMKEVLESLNQLFEQKGLQLADIKHIDSVHNHPGDEINAAYMTENDADLAQGFRSFLDRAGRRDVTFSAHTVTARGNGFGIVTSITPPSKP